MSRSVRGIDEVCMHIHTVHLTPPTQHDMHSILRRPERAPVKDR
jgi:hypothetical protein